MVKYLLVIANRIAKQLKYTHKMFIFVFVHREDFRDEVNVEPKTLNVSHKSEQ